jgi:hypothetical protein
MKSGTKTWITRLLLMSAIGCSANEKQRGEPGASAGVSPTSIVSKADTGPTGSHKAQSILAVLRSFIDLSGADYDLSVCEEAGVATAEIRDSLQRGHFAMLPRLLPCRSDIVPRFGKVWVTASTCAAGKCNVSGRFFRGSANWQFDAETYSLGRTGRHSVLRLTLSGMMTVD